MKLREVPVSSKLGSTGQSVDLLCFSHLRWDFVFQRPQHLLSRSAKERRTFIFEEPIVEERDAPSLDCSPRPHGVTVCVPRLPLGLSQDQAQQIQQELLDAFLAEKKIDRYVAWYYTPMALGFSSHLRPLVTVYDCMDELAAFKGAPPILRERELELFDRADVVFTGGHTLYKAKKQQHENVFPFPSSIEREHFAKAREEQTEPADQAGIPHPRFGFYGVVDERFDIDLLREIAALRPEWNFVILGPVVKIDPESLPRAANIHYLGQKKYDELPVYLAGWDAALLLFARNESTKYISPTKTPEYLAGGKPVVSTSITDVVSPYGVQKLVHIADEPAEFVAAIERALQQRDDADWLKSVDHFLSQNSWDQTWSRMWAEIERLMQVKQQSNTQRSSDSDMALAG